MSDQGPFRPLTLHADDGAAIRFFEAGSGEPVFFLHGWTSSFDRSLDFLTRLAGRYRVLAWDARGHGSRPDPVFGPIGVDRLTDDLKQALDQLGLAGVRMIGHSMGAALAWRLMERFGPALVRQSVVIDMTPRLGTGPDWPFGVYFDFPPERQRAFQAALDADLPETVLRLVADGKNALSRKLFAENHPVIAAQRAVLARLDGPALAGLWADLMRLDFREFLAGLDVPTLLIFGGESQFYGRPLADWLQKALPRAELLFLPEADHAPQLAHAAACAEAVLDFFSRG